MAGGRYAEGTSVDSGRSRQEIEKTLARYGATSFAYGWEPTRAVIQFEIDGRRVRFVLPMPDRQERRFTHTPTTDKPRSSSAAENEYEQAVRQAWRALALVVKAKLEAVAAGIVTFDEEFLAHLVLPTGETVFQHAGEAVQASIATGRLRPMLQLEADDA
ncbi:hypothetical protein [Tersicoccus sp. Bi-70]|uniref:hypothetical protein n=1 Tax=Tersicoccus sp. Bi-70 TaxID=1897634 RepID=UPI000975CD56|nr:hypothetical protein [Tersicoccus sp. Bi-70]OMH30633.1 hypothetical protein BGP79_11785 [Tersicoccus sp. Bi-70]